jgi:hypothetical protein
VAATVRVIAIVVALVAGVLLRNVRRDVVLLGAALFTAAQALTAANTRG